ncbi:DinB family protein [Rossellomorea aquimaris]|uniref:DinB family protein n=1 Tax=Rossellomorea aquimaris TaxID=189382 RepID=UPI001CD256A0|nr:DinB family protein [Rossellomorea aquimaris]MCA1055921.1 DinB family protein [Rossellomorea aquimaris]
MEERRAKIIQHHQNMLQWVRSLNALSAEDWLRPIADDKWSTAEIISHFAPWDDFVVTKRLPHLGTSQPLPEAPDPDILNRQAVDARSKEQSHVITTFINARERLLQSLLAIPEEKWTHSFKLAGQDLTLSDYLDALVEHDLHHQQQIQQVLTKKNAQIWVPTPES